MFWLLKSFICHYVTYAILSYLIIFFGNQLHIAISKTKFNIYLFLLSDLCNLYVDVFIEIYVYNVGFLYMFKWSISYFMASHLILYVKISFRCVSHLNSAILYIMVYWIVYKNIKLYISIINYLYNIEYMNIFWNWTYLNILYCSFIKKIWVCVQLCTKINNFFYIYK